MEGKKRALFRSGAFRIYEDGDLVGLEELAGAVDGHHGISRIFTVDGHHAAAADDAAVERDLKVFGFRDERRIVFGEDLPGQKRIKVRSVIADEEHLLSLRDLVQALKVILDAHDAHADRGGVHQKEAVELRVGVIFLLRVDEHRRNEREEEKKDDPGDLDADDRKNSVQYVKQYFHNIPRGRRSSLRSSR